MNIVFQRSLCVSRQIRRVPPGTRKTQSTRIAYLLRCRTSHVHLRKNRRVGGIGLAFGCAVYAVRSRVVCSMAMDGIVGSCACLCFAFAFVPILSPATNERVQKPTDELDDIKWSVATIVSFLPYFNWTSWLLVAFDSEFPLAYYLLSALYLAPSIESGFQMDSFTVFMIVLGVLHIQVERIAQTEPEFLSTMKNDDSVDSINPLGLVISLFQQFKKQSPLKVSSKKKLPSGSGKTSISELVDKELNKSRKELEDAKELAQLEKQFWDDEFDNRGE
eukprot:g7333.t1